MGKLILGYKTLRNKTNGVLRGVRVPIYDDWFEDGELFCECGKELRTDQEKRDNMCRECV